MISASSSQMSRLVSPLTVAAVPTGINTGVVTSPCAVWITPRRALDFADFFKSSNGFSFTKPKLQIFFWISMNPVALTGSRMAEAVTIFRVSAFGFAGSNGALRFSPYVWAKPSGLQKGYAQFCFRQEDGTVPLRDCGR